AAQRLDRLADFRDRPLGPDPDPVEKLVRPARQPKHEAAARQLVERCGRHRHLSRMQRVRVDDARPDLDALGRLRYRRQDHPRAAQKQVVTDPELVEPSVLSCSGKPRIQREWQVVVQPEAELHPALASLASTAASITASASLSTSSLVSASATCTLSSSMTASAST